MKYQKILIGAAAGAAVAGLGFLLFHPSGKKFRRKAADLGLDAVDKMIDYVRASKADFQDGAQKAQDQSRSSSVTGTL
jgi:gas vesicle protein